MQAAVPITDIIRQPRAETFLRYDEAIVPKPFGLVNTGAICWCNALFQFLLSQPALNREVEVCSADLESIPMANAYLRLVRDALRDTGADTGAHTAALSQTSAALVPLIISRAQKLSYGHQFGLRQECADEGFTLFLNMFDCKDITRLFTTSYEVINRCPHCNTTSSTRDEALRIQIGTDIEFTDQDSFTKYLYARRVPVEKYTCVSAACGEVTYNGTRDEILRMAREVIVFTFNKFYSKPVKWFPQEFYLQSRGGKTLRYQLTAIIEHAGGMHGGHYWAKVLRQGKWYQLNDTGVSLTTPEPTSAAYMIAYHIMPEDTPQ